MTMLGCRAAIVVGLTLVMTACTSAGSSTRPAPLVNPNLSLVADGGQFVVTCRFSHHRPDDPIMHAGMPGMSHQHEFFGNTSTAASSTGASLRRHPTTCSEAADRSAYWVPSLLVNGRRVAPNAIDAYYRIAPGVDPTDVRPFPAGLQAIAGDQTSATPQSTSVVAWTCGHSPAIGIAPPSCSPGRPLTERLTFPSCWDGRHASSPSDVTYPDRHGCPAAHPVAVPQLTLVVHYPLTGPLPSVALASGSIYSGHGDFLDGWDPRFLGTEVRSCLDHDATCGIVGGTFHTGIGHGNDDTPYR